MSNLRNDNGSQGKLVVSIPFGLKCVKRMRCNFTHFSPFSFVARDGKNENSIYSVFDLFF